MSADILLMITETPVFEFRDSQYRKADKTVCLLEAYSKLKAWQRERDWLFLLLDAVDKREKNI